MCGGRQFPGDTTPGSGKSWRAEPIITSLGIAGCTTPQALPATEPVLGANPSSSILNNQWHPVQTTSDHVGPALTCQWLPSQSQTLQHRICHCASRHSPRSSLRAPWILQGHGRPAPASGSNCCSLCFQCSSQRWAWLSPSPLPGLYSGVSS